VRDWSSDVCSSDLRSRTRKSRDNLRTCSDPGDTDHRDLSLPLRVLSSALQRNASPEQPLTCALPLNGPPLLPLHVRPSSWKVQLWSHRFGWSRNRSDVTGRADAAVG
jgi:hypothetical protein